MQRNEQLPIVDLSESLVDLGHRHKLDVRDHDSERFENWSRKVVVEGETDFARRNAHHAAIRIARLSSS